MERQPHEHQGVLQQPGAALNHEQTLAWINEHRCWQLARKTEAIWSRPVAQDEIGKEFQTADRAVEKARDGVWLCVGVANEPWFQSLQKIDAKYDRTETVTKKFPFDDRSHEYSRFQPKPSILNWVACIEGPEIASFSVRPGYDPSTVLHSEAGGYVVKGEVADPYHDSPNDVWLVQREIFEQTYELMPSKSHASR